MTLPTAPDPRMRRAAAMTAAGRNDGDICAALNVPPTLLDLWKQSPLWQEVVCIYKEQLAEQGEDTVAELLEGDAVENLRFVREVRDGAWTDTKERMDVRLKAAFKLLDKTVPDANQRAAMQAAQGVLRLDARLLAQALRALKNVDVLDTTAEEIAEVTGIGAEVPILTAEDIMQRVTATPPSDEDPEEV